MSIPPRAGFLDWVTGQGPSQNALHDAAIMNRGLITPQTSFAAPIDPWNSHPPFVMPKERPLPTIKSDPVVPAFQHM